MGIFLLLKFFYGHPYDCKFTLVQLIQRKCLLQVCILQYNLIGKWFYWTLSKTISALNLYQECTLVGSNYENVTLSGCGT